MNWLPHPENPHSNKAPRVFLPLHSQPLQHNSRESCGLMLAATSVCLIQEEMQHSLKSSSWSSEGRCEDANGTLTSQTAEADLVDVTWGVGGGYDCTLRCQG